MTEILLIKPSVDDWIDGSIEEPLIVDLDGWDVMSKPVTKSFGFLDEDYLVSRMRHSLLLLHGSVEIDPEVMGGLPVIKNTRITLAQILAELAETDGVQEVAENWTLDPDVLVSLLRGMAIFYDRPYARK